MVRGKRNTAPAEAGDAKQPGDDPAADQAQTEGQTMGDPEESLDNGDQAQERQTQAESEGEADRGEATEGAGDPRSLEGITAESEGAAAAAGAYLDEVLNIASSTLAGDLRDICLNILKHEGGVVWNKRSKEDQRIIIDRVSQQALTAARAAAEIMAAGSGQKVKAECVSVTIKDGVKATIEALPTEENILALAGAAGHSVYVVTAWNKDFEGERSAVKVVDPQGAFPLEDKNDKPLFDQTPAGRA